MGMNILAAVLSALCGYLLGGIDFAIIVSKRLYDTDVRTLGSGNAGMTNILRNFGKKGAALTLLGDAGKGVVSVLLGYLFFYLLAGGTNILYGGYIAGLAAILGHMYPAWFRFKGGKGVSVACGVLLTLQPIEALLLVGVFLIIVKATGMVSLGSITSISLYPVFTFISRFFFTKQLVVFSTACAAFVALLIVYMHRENIGRIRAGTEYRFGKKGQSQQAPPPEAPQTDIQAIIDED